MSDETAKAERFERVGLNGKAWGGKEDKFGGAAKTLRAGTGQPVEPGPIAMIDMGVISHADYVGRVTSKNVLAHPQSGRSAPSASPHATEVASILATHCTAQIIHYNVWRESGEDVDALIAALDDVLHLDPRPSVLNLSIGHPVADADTTVRGLIKACIGNGIIVVAAGGENRQNTPLFPASEPDVLAVGAVDPFGQPVMDANGGVCIEFPGENIVVIQEDGVPRKQNGSSYATALASAAVWDKLHEGPIDVNDICRAHRAAVEREKASAADRRVAREAALAAAKLDPAHAGG